jgi:tRNA pseudouridine55 synthase
MNGLLVIDKPGGMTSRDVVNRVQRWFPRKTKIGHTGTLDPLATGVLVVCVGAATRLADFVQAMGKTYRSRFRLGGTSTTDDANGTVTANPAAVPPTSEQIAAAIPFFVGNVEQVPPAFSALKVSGARAHELAREGKDVSLAARTVRIDAIRVLGYDWPFLDVEIDCGKGTYIRSIARDLGVKLGCGGMVESLRRTRVGPFLDEDAVGLDLPAEKVGEHLVPPSVAVSRLPVVRVFREAEIGFLNGREVPYTFAGPILPGSEVCVHGWLERFLGVGTIVAGGRVKPVIVFAT